MSTGERLALLRKEKGMTMKTLSKMIGVPETTYACWERNERRPKFESLEALADFFNVDIGYIQCTQEERTRVSIKDYDDVIDFLCELKQRPEGEMFFATLRGATKEDILKAVKIIDALKGDSN